MRQIDRGRPVMVTGATGYVAGHIVNRLLEQGFVVHAAVRNPDNAEKLNYLRALANRTPGHIYFFRSDLLEVGSYSEAMQSCELVFHTASPCQLSVENPQKDLVDPALIGTRNVLKEACRTESVKRVVVTSSCAAIYGDTADVEFTTNNKFSEADWNTTSSLSHQPYSYSKQLAEHEAWKIARTQQRWDLITINPSMIVGPGISPHATSASFDFMKKFGDGSMKSGVPDFGIGIVDVTDVAEAHIKAGFTPSASGRYLVSADNTSFAEVGRILRNHFGDTWPFPRKTVPKLLVWLAGPIVDKTLTRKMVWRNVGHSMRADNSRSVRELGLKYRPFEVSLIRFFQQIADAGLISR
ncbi:MAG: NAD-dependent epimerase/dehydratase family protein [Fuerstiella sp.]|nr:NAD-dependent epimerase/dehydratase family protein [Fuerstiella sp.]